MGRRLFPIFHTCASHFRDAPVATVSYVEIEHSQENYLPEGQFYHDQIIGLQVRTADDELIGTVTDILSGTSNDNYIVRSPNGEVLIPAIEDLVLSINVGQGIITIEPMEGLLKLNRKIPGNNQAT